LLLAGEKVCKFANFLLGWGIFDPADFPQKLKPPPVTIAFGVW